MLCLEHLFAATSQTVCMAPWTWWDRLSETDQATWFGACGAAAAFLGGLFVYGHGKRAADRREQARATVSRLSQCLSIAIVLDGVTKKLSELIEFAAHPPDQIYQDLELRSALVPGVDDFRAAVSDGSVFTLNEMHDISALLMMLREINQRLGDVSYLDPDERRRVGRGAVSQIERLTDVRDLGNSIMSWAFAEATPGR